MNLYTAFAMFELFNGMTIAELHITKRVFDGLLDDNKPEEAAAYIERMHKALKEL